MKSQISIFPHLAQVSLGLLLAISSHAEITLVDSVGFANTTGSGDDTDGNPATRTVGSGELGGFDANGVDKLVVTIGGEGNSNGAENNTVTSVTYGGVAMLPVLSRYGNGNRGTSMWHLDNVTVSGDFVITFEQSQSGLGFGAYALNGTLEGFAETASTSQTMNPGALDAYNADMEMTTTLPGEFIVAAFGRNNMDNGGGLGIQPPLVELFYGATNGSSAASAYQFVPSPATVTPTIYRLSNGVGAVIAASFQPAPETSRFRLFITPASGNPGSYDFTWDSQDGKIYDLVSDTGLTTAPANWAVWDGNADILSDGASTSLTDVPGGGDTTRFFAVIEKDPPPVSVFSDDFESGQGEWTVGSDGADGTAWELGSPGAPGPAAANSPTNCFGTNLTSTYGLDANVWLRSPPIDLTTAGGATLRFFSAHDIEPMFDSGSIRVLDATDDSELAVLESALEGTALSWAQRSYPVPNEALGQNVKFEFRLEADDFSAFAGWYIDDINVIVP